MTQESYQQRERTTERAPGWVTWTWLTLASSLLLVASPAVEGATAGGMKLTWSEKATASDYKVAPVTDGGTLTGVVHLDGAYQATPIPVSKDQATCGNELKDPSAAVSAKGEIQWAFVYLEGVRQGKAGVKTKVRIVNQGCLYAPFVQGGLAGAPIEVENDDAILHNVHSYYGRRTLWNLGLPIQGMKVPKKLPARPGVIQFKCDLHEWMYGWIHVMGHPYFATTDAAGKFSIEEVPAGSYTLVVQHPRWGDKRVEVEVSGGKSTDVDVSLQARQTSQ